MQSKLIESLRVKNAPVAVLLTDEKPSEGLQFKSGRMGCVAAMLLTASKGRTAFFDRHTFGCPGGGTGLGFGNCYEGFPIERLLSTGGKAQLGNGQPYDMHEGERFHRSAEVTAQWLAEFPFGNLQTEYVVFKPLSAVDGDDPIAMVMLFVNPDQLSALVTLAGFDSGAVYTSAAPWGASCHAIAFALAEAQSERPRGVIGFFDISQRHRVDRDILSFTVPYRLFRTMEANVDASFLALKPWQKLQQRQA